MKTRLLILITTLCLSASAALAAEKNKALMQLDTARAAVEAMAAKAADNREAAAGLELARAAIKKGADAAEKGRQMFGFGGIKPEAEQEVKNYADIAELETAAVASRLEKGRSAAELEALDKQLAGVKARIKLFEDRKAELEKYKAEAAKCQGAAGEIETLKAEKARLSARSDKQEAEIRELKARLEEAAKANVCKEAAPTAAPVKTLPAPAETPAAKEPVPAKPLPTVEIPDAQEPAPAVKAP